MFWQQYIIATKCSLWYPAEILEVRLFTCTIYSAVGQGFMGVGRRNKKHIMVHSAHKVALPPLKRLTLNLINKALVERWEVQGHRLSLGGNGLVSSSFQGKPGTVLQQESDTTPTNMRQAPRGLPGAVAWDARRRCLGCKRRHAVCRFCLTLWSWVVFGWSLGESYHPFMSSCDACSCKD